MSKYCFLCLSDEGVFLNITHFNYKSMWSEVESYFPLKIEEIKPGKQSKVCYKCAYELKQCSDFIRKYKESHTNAEKNIFRKQCCNICLEPAKKGYIFKLNKNDNPLNNLWSIIEKLFDGNFPEIRKSPLICLTCRYILDILLDLTSLCQEMSKLKEKFNKDIDYSEIPKVSTTVIKRKTTTTSFMRLKTHVLSDSDSDSNTSKNKSTKEMNKYSQSKLRSCDQCKNSIKHGEDMYRFHRSGLTVCTTCRGSMDFSRHNKRKSEQTTTNTKLCTVFLKDVLADTALKQQKAYRIETDSYGNQVYIITESESEVEAEDKVSVSGETEKIQVKSRTRSQSSIKSDSSDSEPKRKKRMKVDNQNKSSVSKLRELPLRSSARRKHHSDTDISPNQSQQNSEKQGVKRQNTSVSSFSDIDVEKKSNRKKLSAILEHFIPSVDKDTSGDMPVTEQTVKEKKTTVNERKRKTRSSSVSPTNEGEYSSAIKHLKPTELSKTPVKKLKSSVKETSPTRVDVKETSPIRVDVKETSPTRVDVNEKSTDENKAYTCNKCCAIHENKLVAATHELSHCKQLELKLHRVNISDKSEDEQQVDELSKKQLNDELAEQQNEEITLTVNDDEDTEMVDMTDDTKKQSDKEICPSTESPKEDLSQKHMINRENIEETKDTDTDTTAAESVHKESTKTSEHEVEMSETTAQSPVNPAPMENESACVDDSKNDQIQNDISNEDKIENEPKKINKEIDTNDKNKISENESVESTESEKNVFDLKITDEDESKENDNVDNTENDNVDNTENDNVDNTENESIKLQRKNIEEIGDDLTDKTEKDKIEELGTDKIEENVNKIEENVDKIEENVDKIEENKKDKIEVAETVKETQKEQNSDKNVSNELKDCNVSDVELNDITNTDETQSNNLSQEKQSIAEHDTNSNDNQETNISTVDNVVGEDSIKNNVSTCNIKTAEDNCNANEEENKPVNESITDDSNQKSKCTNDTNSSLTNLEKTNSYKSITDAVKEKADQDLSNETTEVVKNMFDLTTDEIDNCESVINQTKKYNETKAETLEDISLEIQKSADMPSLEPISSTEVDHKELV